MKTYNQFKEAAETLVDELMAHSAKRMNVHGDLMWTNASAVLTRTSAKILGDEYDELNGWRIYGIEVLENEERW